MKGRRNIWRTGKVGEQNFLSIQSCVMKVTNPYLA